MGKKKKVVEPPCVRCIVVRVDARLDQTLDAYKDLRPFIAIAYGAEADFRLQESRYWFNQLVEAADHQGLAHTCRLGTTGTTE